MTTAHLKATIYNKIKLLSVPCLAMLLAAYGDVATAQETKTTYHKRSSEKYGNTLNIGLGIGYYGYFEHSTPFITANYEFSVARNFTLAPFIGIASYRSDNRYFYGRDYYYYHETFIPLGAKGTYYFDELLGAGPKWDFYLAASVGFTFHKVVWDDGYHGSTGVIKDASPLYLDGHIGAEYHFNRRVGMYLDLSTGVSTIGVAFHGK